LNPQIGHVVVIRMEFRGKTRFDHGMSSAWL
jgi:hypothetical protein